MNAFDRMAARLDLSWWLGHL